MDIAEEKRRLRKQASGLRKKLHRAMSSAAAPHLVQHFRNRFRVQPGTPVAAYWPVFSEVDVRPLLHHLHERGAICLLPAMIGADSPLVFRRWTPETVMAPGHHGIPVPPAGAMELRPSIVIAPMLAYDSQGYRLGYGGGHYDRALAALRNRGDARLTVVGAAYHDQEVDKIPHDAYDQRLDHILTEQGLHKIEP